MSKEAMKLALDALTETYAMTSHAEILKHKAITALREALAEQPARPYRQLQDNGSKYFGESWDKAEQSAQQEPVAHRDGFWCADLTCKKCYSADFRFKHKNSVVNESLTTPAQQGLVAWRRWDYINTRALTISISKYEALCNLLHIEIDDERFDLGEAIDRAIEAK